MNNNSELKAQLIGIHSELEKATTSTAKERDVLGHVMGDIVRLSQGEELSHHDEPESLRAVLEERASTYEVDHPRAAALIRQVLDILAKMGI